MRLSIACPTLCGVKFEPIRSSRTPYVFMAWVVTCSQTESNLTHFIHRLSTFKSSLSKAFASRQAQSLPIDDIIKEVNSDPSTQFSNAEVRAGLQVLHDTNKVMVAENVVFTL